MQFEWTGPQDNIGELTLMILEDGNFHWDLEKQTTRIKYFSKMRSII